jgi:hypothetical protein
MSPQLFEQIMSRFTFTGNILYHIMKWNINSKILSFPRDT